MNKYAVTDLGIIPGSIKTLIVIKTLVPICKNTESE